MEYGVCKMTDYHLGSDASKGYCDFVILNKSKEIVEPNFQLDDTSNGHQILIKTLKALFAKKPDMVLYAGLESTGGYESNWYNTLLNLKDTVNIKVARLNPLGVNHQKKAGLERNSTDKISARVVAEYLIDHGKNIVYNREDAKVALKKEWKFIKMLSKQCVQLLNQFESALYNTHPHLLTYCSSEVSNWLLKVVMQYPSAVRLSGARPKTLAKIPFVTLERAKELVKNAKESIGAEQDEVTEIRLKSLAQQILHLRQLIKTQTKAMKDFCPFPEIEIIESFVGISEFSAVGLMLVIDNIERFKYCEKLSSYVGVHPVYKDSGDGTGGYRMSKQGSKEVRSILFNVARCAIVHNEMIKNRYEHYLAEGKEKMSAIGIIMHKILRIIYGMLKNNQKYDPQVDQANREKSIKKKTENGNGNGTKPDKNRRYQERDQNAPISRRQQKKRKQLQLVQTQQIANKENGKTDKQTNSQGMLKQREKA
jgi:transposase